MRWTTIVFCLFSGAFASAQEYVIDTIAGGAAPPEQVAAVNAGIGMPQGVALDAAGNLYFTSLNCVFKVDAVGLLTRVAGNARPGYSGDGGPARIAQLFNPMAISFDGGGNLYIVDSGNNRIRKVSADGIITTVAGSAQLKNPTGIAVDRGGSIYVADPGNNLVSKIGTDGSMVTGAGTGVAGYSGDGGPASAAQLSRPVGVTLDIAGNLYISDGGNSRIRKVGPHGTITTVAMTGAAPAWGVVADMAGNVYYSDFNGVRKIASDGSVTTVAAPLNGPRYLAANAGGDLYVAESGNNRVQRISPAGTIVTVAGDGSPGLFFGDGGPATDSLLSRPLGVAVNSVGDLLIADTGNGRVRQVLPDGVIITVAGGGSTPGSDGVPATSGQLRGPTSVAFGPTGDLFIADFDASTRALRVSSDRVFVNLSLGRVGEVLQRAYAITVDRNGTVFVLDDNIVMSRILEIPTSGNIRTAVGGFHPLSMGLDFEGRIYFSNLDDVIYTASGHRIAGKAPPPFASFGGDGGPAINASFYAISGLAFDYQGNLYISDAGNQRIRKVTLDGIVNTIAGTGVAGYSGDGGLATNAQLNFPGGLAVDLAGNVYVADAGNNSVRVLRPAAMKTW